MPIKCVGGIQWGWCLIVAVGERVQLAAGQVTIVTDLG